MRSWNKQVSNINWACRHKKKTAQAITDYCDKHNVRAVDKQWLKDIQSSKTFEKFCEGYSTADTLIREYMQDIIEQCKEQHRKEMKTKKGTNTMAEIIDVKNLKKKTVNDLTPDEIADAAKNRPNLVTCELNGLKAYVWERPTTGFAVFVIQKEPYNAIGKVYYRIDAALKVYHALETHIIAQDRNYTELCGILKDAKYQEV